MYKVGDKLICKIYHRGIYNMELKVGDLCHVSCVSIDDKNSNYNLYSIDSGNYYCAFFYYDMKVFFYTNQEFNQELRKKKLERLSNV